MIRETPPWGDMDRDTYIAQIVQTGWKTRTHPEYGHVFRHAVAAADAGLPSVPIFVQRWRKDSDKGWAYRAFFPVSSPLGDVPPEFDPSNYRRAAVRLT
jgi:hypothetical protein